jgi:hypothetical protein
VASENEFKFTCIVDRTPREVTIEESKNWTIIIDKQWLMYVFTDMDRFNLAIGLESEEFHNWHTPNNFRLLIARDAVNVLLKGRASLFTSTHNGKIYAVSQNEITNALAQERTAALARDEAIIIEMLLVFYEDSIPITPEAIYISTDYSMAAINRRLNIFSKRQFLMRPTTEQYAIPDATTYDTLELRLDKLYGREARLTPHETHQFRYLNPIKPQANKPIAFVGLPFGLADHFDAIEQICTSNGFLGYRIDHDPRFDTFLNKVMGAVLVSKVCIFDVTGFNANVMLELGAAMSTDKDIIVIAEEKQFVEAQDKWRAEIQNNISSNHFEQLEQYLKDSKFINLVPSDVRERPVLLFKDIADLKAKLNIALNQITL